MDAKLTPSRPGSDPVAYDAAQDPAASDRTEPARASVAFTPGGTDPIAAEAPAVVAPQRRGRLSPINRRRWDNFKANRRGYWSFWLFMVLFVLSLGSEFIANDQPF